jgi:membrane protease YdiL (CAAX protease family)
MPATHQSLVLLLAGAPLLEEIVFRLGLQEQLLRARMRPAAANASTALVFALAHGIARSWSLAAWVLVPACALGWLYQHGRRVAPCVAAHSALNLAWLGLAALAPARLACLLP